MKFAIALTLIFAAVTSALGARLNLPRRRSDWRAQVSVAVALILAAWFLFAAWWVWAKF